VLAHPGIASPFILVLLCNRVPQECRGAGSDVRQSEAASDIPKPLS